MTEPPPEFADRLTGRSMACSRCDTWIQFRFGRPLDEIEHFFYGKQYITLEPFPVILYCPTCGDEVETTGHEMTIDTATNTVIRCRVVRVPEAEDNEPGQ